VQGIYEKTFDQLDFREEPLDTTLRHCYPFFFENDAAKKNFSQILDEVCGSSIDQGRRSMVARRPPPAGLVEGAVVGHPLGRLGPLPARRVQNVQGRPTV